MHELKTLPKDLQLCTDMATGVDSLGQYQFGDMVQIDAQTVGVIVQIQKENFQVWSVVTKSSLLMRDTSSNIAMSDAGSEHARKGGPDEAGCAAEEA